MSGTRYSLPEFANALRKMSAEVRSVSLGKAAYAGGFALEGYAKIKAMEVFRKVTGNLAGSISTTLVSASGNEAVAEVGPTAVYGRIQELGGTIRPLTKKMLHWVDEEGNHHKAFLVTLPARPYLRPATEEHINDVMEAVAVSLRYDIEAMI